MAKTKSKQTKEDKIKLVKTLLSELGIGEVNIDDIISLNEVTDEKGRVTKLHKFSLKKQMFISCYLNNFGNITKSCVQAKITRKSYYYWMDHDSVFNDYIKGLSIKEVKKDYVESKVFDLIDRGDVSAIIYAAKVLLRDRGYAQNQEDQRGVDDQSPVFYLPDNGRGHTKDVTFTEEPNNQLNE